MTEGLEDWRFVVLMLLAAVAPFNVKITSEAWTDLNLRLLIVLALAAVVAIVVTNLIRSRWRVDVIDRVVYLWLGAVWVSALLSENTVLGAGGAARLSVAILLIPAVRGTIHSQHDVRQLLRALAFGSVAGGLVGFGIWWLGADLDATKVFVGTVTAVGPHNRLTRPWAHANIAGMAIGATMATAATLPQGLRRGAALCSLTIALVLTVSRGGVVASLAAGVAWVVLRRRGRDAAAVSALAAVGLITLLLSTAWTARIDQPGDAAFYASSIEVADEITVGADSDLIDVTVTNESVTTWRRTGDDQVLISARWLGPDGLIWTEDRWQLPHDLAPGQSVRTGLTLGPRVPAGSYRVQWDLMIDQTAYFGQFLGEDPTLSQASVVNSLVLPGDNVRYELVQPSFRVGRPDAWRLAWQGFKATPLLGAGPNQFATHAVADLAERGTVVGAHAHNIVLEPLATWGLLGTIPFLLLGAGSLLGSLRLAWRTRGTEVCAVAVGLVAVVVHGLVDWPLAVVTTGIPVGMLLGIALSGAALDKNVGGHESV